MTTKQFQDFRTHQSKFIYQGSLSKRSGGVRTVYFVQDDGFRNFLKILTLMLSEFYIPPDCVHGFVVSRSIVTNAQQHTRKKLLLNLDIKSFFESIKIDKVEAIFVEIGFKKEHASILSKLVTVDGVLATGFSTSPVLANIVSRQMDNELEKLCNAHNAIYTRYADDLSISSDATLPSMADVTSILASNDFLVNEHKCKLSRRGGCQYVTGLTVCDSVPRLSKRLKRNIRLELYYIRKYGLNEHVDRTSKISRFVDLIPSREGITGYVAYINSVEPKFANFIKQSLIRPSPGLMARVDDSDSALHFITEEK
ncbi:MAG: reverse transcriptase family protein [Patescibacteria group bacterium]